MLILEVMSLISIFLAVVLIIMVSVMVTNQEPETQNTPKKSKRDIDSIKKQISN